MILLSSINEAITRIERSERPARLCELCLARLADNVFTYEFEDGEVLFAEICWQCSGECDHEIATKILAVMLDRNETQIQVLEWLIADG